MRFPKGFSGGSTKAGLKASGKPDVGLVVSDRPCVAAGMFTKNRFAGANIPFCRKVLRRGSVRAVVVHAGQANACTGREGQEVARQTAVAVSGSVGCGHNEVIVGSTGVIGVLPDLARIQNGIRSIAEKGLAPEGLLAAGKAMMTTDTVQKTVAVRFLLGGKMVSMVGIAKGSGMIHPNMATMLSYVFTDAKISKTALRIAFRDAVEGSFNCLTVDGDTSTSDMAVVLANGAAGNREVKPQGKDFATFAGKLAHVCTTLSRMVARDGEGATRLVTVRVRRAATFEDARRAAKAVANSNLVKTAVFGRDPNWGRIACAIGYCGARFAPEKVTIRLGRALIFAKEKPAAYDRKALSKYLADSEEVLVDISLGSGRSEAVVSTCDLSYDYVRINAEYTT